MEPKAIRYHLEINGIAEGPMSAKDLAWKIGMANGDDVILFRREGEGQWTPLEGNRDAIMRLAEDEQAAPTEHPSPPKLKLKRRGESVAPQVSPEDAPSSPPPIPGALPQAEPMTDADTPPPPPGAPDSSDDALTPAQNFIPTTQSNQGTSLPPPAAGQPILQPPRIAPLLIASFLITAVIAGYLFFFMGQPVAGSARASMGTSGARQARDLRYSIISHQVGQRWKATAIGKLTVLGDNAKAVVTSSSASTDRILAEADELAQKYSAECRSLFMVGTNARYLGISDDHRSKPHVKATLQLESASDIAEGYLSEATRADLAGGRYKSVALAARNEGFPRLAEAFEKDVRATEAALEAEYARLRPVVDEALRFLDSMKYVVPAGTEVLATGTTDESGRFEPSLSPGSYYFVATQAGTPGEKKLEWAVSFTVKPLNENTVTLDDRNRGDSSPEALWQAADTHAAENAIAAAEQRAQRVGESLNRIREIRAGIIQFRGDLDRLLAR